MSKHFIFFLILTGFLNVQAGQSFSQAARCKFNKTSGACKDPRAFAELVKNQCVEAYSTCRASFCKIHCLKEIPTEESLKQLCIKECNPSKKEIAFPFEDLLLPQEVENYYRLYDPKEIDKERYALLPECAKYVDVKQTSLTCDISTSACENPQTFEALLKNRCVKFFSSCRASFCKEICLGENPPNNENIKKLCTRECNPLGKDVGPVLDSLLGLTPVERTENRNKYYARYGNRNILREREITKARGEEDSHLPWCEEFCDYNENAPSCARKEGAATWAVCSKQCSFIPDMRKHIEGCLRGEKVATVPLVPWQPAKPRNRLSL